MDQSTWETVPIPIGRTRMSRLVADRYELFDDLGGSDVAHVFRAWDHQLQHIVAVKMLNANLAASQEIVEAFEQQASFVASLPEHTNIVAVHAVEHDEARPFIVMQFVTGSNLKDVIAREAPLSVERAFRLCRQMAQGLDFAHQFGLVHGDLKPQNALVSRHDEVKLTDFGMVRAEELAEARRTAMVMVRAQYLAPEQALGRTADATSDVYSLGVVLYEMLTGKLPFSADSPMALAKKHVLEDPPNPHQVNPIISPGAARIVLKALSKEPEERYRSAGAFAAALQEYLLLDKGETAKNVFSPQLRALAEGEQVNGRSSAAGDAQLRALEPERPAITPATKPAAVTSVVQAVPPVSTPRAEPSPLFQSRTVEQPRTQPAQQQRTVAPQAISAKALLRPPTPRNRRLKFSGLIYLAVLGIAAAGGWYTYKAIWSALNGSSTPPPTQKKHVAAPAKSTRKPVSKSGGQGAIAGGCAVHQVGPVRLLDIWAAQIRVSPQKPVTFYYTIANDAPQCRDVFLGLTMYSATRPGVVLTDPSGDKVIGAQPGKHRVQRQFTFPASAAGQTFDVAWSVAPPSKTQTYQVWRVPRLIVVGP